MTQEHALNVMQVDSMLTTGCKKNHKHVALRENKRLGTIEKLQQTRLHFEGQKG